MKLKIKYILAVLTLTVLATSCGKTTPSGFWTNFHKDLIRANNSDHGLWGGHTEIHWKSEIGKTFSSREIVDFASKNGWQLTDSLIYTSDSLRHLTNYGNTNYSIDILKENVLKRMKTDNYIFVFKTGWIAVEPGNARDTENNGFVAINSYGTELIVFHLWRE